MKFTVVETLITKRQSWLRAMVLAFVMVVFFVPLVSHGKLYSSIMDKSSDAGRCLPPQKGTTSTILSRNNFKIAPDATAAERASLAKVVSTIEQMGGGTFPWIRQGIKVNFTNDRTSTGGPFELWISRNESFRGKKCNHGSIAHELGHSVAMTSGLYEEYQRKVGVGTCGFTKYTREFFDAKKGRTVGGGQEEFAEVFGAFVSNPGLLKRDPNCKRAYKFMVRAFGPQSEAESCEERARKKYSFSPGYIYSSNSFCPWTYTADRSGRVAACKYPAYANASKVGARPSRSERIAFNEVNSLLPKPQPKQEHTNYQLQVWSALMKILDARSKGKRSRKKKGRPLNRGRRY